MAEPQRPPRAGILMALGWGLVALGGIGQFLSAIHQGAYLLMGLGGAFIIASIAIRLSFRGEPAGRRIAGTLGAFVGGGLIAAGVMFTALWGGCVLLSLGFSGGGLGPALMASAVLAPPPIACFVVGGLILLASRRSRSNGDRPND